MFFLILLPNIVECTDCMLQMQQKKKCIVPAKYKNQGKPLRKD